MSKPQVSALLALILCLTLLSGCAMHVERRVDSTPTLYVGAAVPAFPTTFMPWLSREGIDPTIASLLFSTLSPYDEAAGLFSQGLAREWYFVDLDGNPITLPGGGIDYDRLEEVYSGADTSYMIAKFHLFEDAVWSDGTKVTAEDVYFTFDLAANYSLSQHAGALVWTNDLQHVYSDGRLRKQGMFTYDRGAAEMGYDIPESQKDTVIYFHVNKVLGGIIPLVSTVLVLPKHIFQSVISEESPLINRDPTQEQVAVFQNPVGCGPFKLDRENTSAQKITLSRRNDFHIKNESGGMLYQPERLVFVLYQDINVAIYALKKGHIDVLDANISANFARLFDDDPDIEVMRAPGQFVQTLVLNINPPADQMTPMRRLLTDRDFRHALSLAVSQEELIKMVLSEAGVTFSHGLVAADQPFYNPGAGIPEGGTERGITEANAILDTIVPERGPDGYRLLDGKRIQFEIIGSPVQQTLISYLQVQFQRIGIDVAFKAGGSTPENTFIWPGNFDMAIQGVSFTQSNIDMMMQAHFVNLVRASNYGRLINDDIAEAVTSMRETLNQNVKFDIARDIQVMIAQEYYKIPLYCSDVISIHRTDRFDNFQLVTGERSFNGESMQQMVFTGN